MIMAIIEDINSSFISPFVKYLAMGGLHHTLKDDGDIQQKG